MVQLLMAVLPAVTRGIGAAMASGDYAKAEELRQQAMNQLNIPLPDIHDLQAQIGNTNLDSVQADPKYTSAENDALGGLKDISQTGMSAQDRLGYAQANLNAGNTYSGLMGSNSQLRASRGQVGSGADTADQFAAASQGANRAYQTGLQTASNAADRRYQALGAYGSMAERLRAADLSQKDMAANAQDRIDQFNTSQKSYGAQQNYQNQLGLAQAKEKAQETAAQQNIDHGKQTEQTAADIGTAASRGAQAYDQGQSYDEFLKKKFG